MPFKCTHALCKRTPKRVLATFFFFQTHSTVSSSVHKNLDTVRSPAWVHSPWDQGGRLVLRHRAVLALPVKSHLIVVSVTACCIFLRPCHWFSVFAAVINSPNGRRGRKKVPWNKQEKVKQGAKWIYWLFHEVYYHGWVLLVCACACICFFCCCFFLLIYLFFRKPRLTTGPGIPRRPSGPGFPGGPWGPTGPVLPEGPSEPASPCAWINRIS